MEQTESLGTATLPEVVAPIAEFSGKPGDLEKDLALLAKEQEAAAPASPEASQVAQNQPEITATAPVTVPEKFKDENGQPDAARIEKSTVDAEVALAKYLEKERALRQKMNEVSQLSKVIPQSTAPVSPAAVPVPLTAFEIAVANDLINEARAFGYEMPQGQAIAQARVQVKMAEARASHEQSLTESLRIKLEDQERRTELESIAKNDPSILSPEGIEALSQIREKNPWINNAPQPWSMAYNLHLAEQTKAARLKGTVLPTPTGSTAKAPPAPVGPAPRVVVAPKGPDLTSKEDIDSHVKTLTREQEAAFWRSKGLKF